MITTATTMSDTGSRDASGKLLNTLSRVYSAEGKAFGLVSPSSSLQTPVSAPAVASASAVGPTTPYEQDHPNPYLPGFSRTAFLRKRLFSRQTQWSEQRPIK